VRNASGVAALTGPSRVVAPLVAVLDAVTFAAPVTASTSMTVQVVGTNISAPVDGSGVFVLTVCRQETFLQSPHRPRLAVLARWRVTWVHDYLVATEIRIV
jgi:hypothetical protein